MTNVVHLTIPDSFAEFAVEFRAAEVRATRATIDWIEAHVALAILYAKGRDMHAGDAPYGRWLNDIGAQASPDYRRAYVAMGRYPERMRHVLQLSTSRSMRLIYEANITQFRPPVALRPAAENCFRSAARANETVENPDDNRLEMSNPESRPAGTLHLPARTPVARPTAEPPAPRVPWLIDALGPELGLPLWLRLNGSGNNTLTTLRAVFRARNGRAALQRYAEVMAAHPEWTPSKSARVLSISVLHTGLRDSYTAAPFANTPANLLKVTDIAIDYAGRLQRAQDAREQPRSVPAYDDDFESLRQFYRRNQEIMEQPLHDEDIYVCGVRVRERGVNVANYTMEWNCTYWILLLMAHGQNMTSFSRDQIRDMGALLGRISGLIFQAMDPHTGQFLQGMATALKNYDGPAMDFEKLFKRAERRMRIST